MWKGGRKGRKVKITNVQATDDYKLLIEFEEGNQVCFSMQRMVETIAYNQQGEVVIKGTATVMPPK